MGQPRNDPAEGIEDQILPERLQRFLVLHLGGLGQEAQTPVAATEQVLSDKLRIILPAGAALVHLDQRKRIDDVAELEGLLVDAFGDVTGLAELGKLAIDRFVSVFGERVLDVFAHAHLHLLERGTPTGGLVEVLHPDELPGAHSLGDAQDFIAGCRLLEEGGQLFAGRRHGLFRLGARFGGGVGIQQDGRGFRVLGSRFEERSHIGVRTVNDLADGGVAVGLAIRLVDHLELGDQDQQVLHRCRRKAALVDCVFMPGVGVALLRRHFLPVVIVLVDLRQKTASEHRRLEHFFRD